RRQALLRVVMVQPEMGGNQRGEESVVLGGQGAALDQDFAQRFRLIQHPRAHCFDQRVAADEVVLDGHDAEEQIQIGSARGHGEGSAEEGGSDVPIVNIGSSSVNEQICVRSHYARTYTVDEARIPYLELPREWSSCPARCLRVRVEQQAARKRFYSKLREQSF